MNIQPNTLNLDLNSFNDSTKHDIFYEFSPQYRVTANVKITAEKQALHWMLLIIFTSQKLACLKDEQLQIWQVQRVSDYKLMIIADNGLNSVLFTKKISGIIFNYDYMRLFWINGLIHLPSEINDIGGFI